MTKHLKDSVLLEIKMSSYDAVCDDVECNLKNELVPEFIKANEGIDSVFVRKCNIPKLQDHLAGLTRE